MNLNASPTKRPGGLLTKTLLCKRTFSIQPGKWLRTQTATKIVLAMKFTAIFLFAVCMQVSAKTFSQNVSIKQKGMSLENVFREIKRQTGYDFWADSKLLKNAPKKDLNLSDVNFRAAIQESLDGTGLSYRIVGKVIVIKEAEIASKEFHATINTPQITVEGRVLDDKTGEPVIGASVVIKGMKKGVSTDAAGRFSITADKGSVLVVSFVSYLPKEIEVKDGDVVTVRLEASPASMKELVITGVFSRNKQNYTGAASSFTSEDLGKVTNSNVLTALKSLDPSFQIPQNINLGSNPNALPEVTLRGGNSLNDIGRQGQENPFNYTNSANTPLFILDGFEVPLQRINDLDMNRIARVDILKDAAATSIYGSRAANGVIVIETIRPKEGELRFTYNASLVVEAPDLTGYNLLDAREKLDIEKQAGFYRNVFNFRQEEVDIIYAYRLAEINKGVNTDWIAKPLRSGVGTKHNIYLEGGSNSMLYGVNITYDQKNGVMKGSDRRNIMGSSFLSYRIKNFQFRNDLTLSYNQANNSPYGSFRQYTRLNPYWSPVNEDGTQKVYLETIVDPRTGLRLTNFDLYDNLDNQGVGRAVNPMYNASLNIVDRTTYRNMTNNFFTQWQALQWLRVTGRLSYQEQYDEYDKFLPAQHTSFVSVSTFKKGSYSKTYGKRTSLEGMLTGDINKRFDDHMIFATLGLNVQEVKSNTESFTVEGFPNARLDQLTLGNRFPDGSKPVGTESLSRLGGLLSNFSYAYDNRYLLDLSYRLDGSSQFGSDKRFAPFWSSGIGWNLHNEKLLSGLNYINRLKLRYSFGYTGSQNFASYLGITTGQYYTDRDYRGIIGTYLLGFGNSALVWQRTQKSNFGADITLFDKLDITANYFIEKTKGSVARVSTAPSSGFDFYNDNMGDVLSKGFEANFRYNIFRSNRGRDNWSVFANLFRVTNTIERVSNTIQAMNKRADTTRSTTPIVRYAEGQSTTAIWAVKSLGIDPSTGDELFLTRDGKITSVYSPLNQVIVGDTRADIEGTFGTNFEKKGIGMNLYFRFRLGGQAYNQTLIDRVENVNVGIYNVDRRVAEERWKQPGDLAFFKGLLDQGGYAINERTYATSRFVQDDNFLSCESASLYYRFSDAFNKRFRLENTRVTLFSNELFWKSSIRRERGLDYPFSRNFTLQFQTTF
ncbi:SusC/RagA family TonB-linked outer membrane protein [Parasegetibacter sp. NRK P23]|uniref:SusC/RagA family TonB-linked outer membrane protein n=1 Tax=Parasegetibacter sp. NRK P23 TaxID=2942999 RepID=UPI002042F450|nr:SusC/RagA family TonB-linked outer membrane protein [Parasegetibacter sp. NRK P23]MCM5528936.1 SusC/RagA family TonB-linked outer membrane protein [Parasegetibacter sp. NRK P23]